VLEHGFLPLRLVDIDAEFLLQPADFAGAACPLVQQPHQHFIHPVDVASEVLEGHVHHVP
jgi:hypothetical protein